MVPFWFISYTLSAFLLRILCVPSVWLISLFFIFLLNNILQIFIFWILFIFLCCLPFGRLTSNILFQSQKVILIFFSINLLQIVFDFFLNRVAKNLAFNYKLPILYIPRFNDASYQRRGFLKCSHRFRNLKIFFLLLLTVILKVGDLVLHVFYKWLGDLNNFLPAFFQNNYTVIKVIKCPFYHFVNFLQLLQHLLAFYLNQNLLQLLFNHCFCHQNFFVEFKKCWILVNHFRWIV